jgi:magnesium chelatase family protein
MVERPYRAPHHTVTYVGLVGGGTAPRPGEITLSHRGVLFLDEFPEFGRQALEALRQPLEDGSITITRAAYTVDMPARLMLIAAMNPSPSGFAEDGAGVSAATARRYRRRISGPLLDRIDVHVDVPSVAYDEMRGTDGAEPSATVRARVAAARVRQLERLMPHDLHVNSEITARLVTELCTPDDDAEALLRSAHDRMGLSGRGHHRILKLARTIADLDAAETIAAEHLAEALQYRPRLEM